MSEMSFDDAAAALSAAGTQDAADNAAQDASIHAGIAQGTSPDAPVTPEVDAGTTSSEDSFTNVDPSQFNDAEALRKAYQADYTRKMQALAEERTQYQGLDLERATQATQFLDALETDPDFVQAVHAQLTQSLVEAGYTPAEAAQGAAQAISGQQATQPQVDEYGEPVVEDPLAREVQELKAWKAEQEGRAREYEAAGRLQQQEMAIRQAHQDLTEPEMDRIYELAFAHGGDLNKAANSFFSWKNDVISSYVNQKASVAAESPSVPSMSGHAEVAQTFGGDLEAATRAAQEHLNAVLANS